MGDEQLSKLAHELTAVVRNNASIDWTRKKSVQAKLRLLVKKLLKKHGYPPDAAKHAVDTVLQQAERLGVNVTEGASETEVEEAAETQDGRPLYDLPYPVAVFDSLLRSQEEASLRVKTQLDAIERAFVLLVAAELGWIRAAGDAASKKAAQTLVDKTGGKRVSMGAWLELAWRLAALTPPGDEHPVPRAARHFVNHKGKPSDLTKGFQTQVVPLRNDTTHGVTVAEEALREHEVPLRKQWEALKAALGPLRELQLVSRAKLKDFDSAGRGATYNLRLLTGSSEHFRIEEARVQGKLEEHWCYLLVNQGQELISLAPLLRLRVNVDTGRRELMVPRTLVLKSGGQVELCQLLGDQTEKLSVR